MIIERLKFLAQYKKFDEKFFLIQNYPIISHFPIEISMTDFQQRLNQSMILKRLIFHYHFHQSKDTSSLFLIEDSTVEILVFHQNLPKNLQK